MTGQVAESKRESLIAETLPSTQFFSKFNRIAYLSPVIKWEEKYSFEDQYEV